MSYCQAQGPTLGPTQGQGQGQGHGQVMVRSWPCHGQVRSDSSSNSKALVPFHTQIRALINWRGWKSNCRKTKL